MPSEPSTPPVLPSLSFVRTQAASGMPDQQSAALDALAHFLMPSLAFHHVCAEHTITAPTSTMPPSTAPLQGSLGVYNVATQPSHLPTPHAQPGVEAGLTLARPGIEAGPTLAQPGVEAGPTLAQPSVGVSPTLYPAPSPAAHTEAGVVTPILYPASPPLRFPCNLCPLSFNRRYDLQRHVYTHTGEKPFLCLTPDCGKTFTRKDALQRHEVQSDLAVHVPTIVF